MKNAYISFDVFDTLISRDVGEPKELFLIVGDRISKCLDLKIKPDLFCGVRINAERELYEMGLEPNLQLIYDTIARKIDLTSLESDQIRDIEVETELESVFPIWDSIDLLRNKRSEGYKIVYISDMYLGKDIINEMLKKFEIILPDENLYVSSNYGKSKRTGELFRHVMNCEGISTSHLVHYGNSITGDVNGAKIVGIESVYLPDGNLSEYESLISSFKNRYPLSADERVFYSKLAGSSRECRLKSKSISKEISSIASSVACPILYFFVKYILEESKNDNIDSLYFLSRDGFILFEIAKKIASEINPECELRYLYISRQVLVQAELTEFPDEEKVRELIKVHKLDNLRDMLLDLGISETELLKASEKMGVDKNILNRSLCKLNLKDILKFLRHKDLAPIIKTKAASRRKSLMNYLEQEGLFLKGKKSALVDVGWNLTIQDKFSKLLREKSQNRLSGYYFGINHANCKPENGLKKAFLWDHRNGADWIDVKQYIKLIEVFCTAPYGQVTGYQKDGGKVAPVFQQSETGALIKWGIKDFHNVISNYFEQFNYLNLHKKKISRVDRILCKEILEKFWHSPGEDELQVWGEFPYYISSDGSSVETLFDRKSKWAYLIQALRSGKKPDVKNKIWTKFSNSGKMIRLLLNVAVVPRKIYNKVTKS